MSAINLNMLRQIATFGGIRLDSTLQSDRGAAGMLADTFIPGAPWLVQYGDLSDPDSRRTAGQAAQVLMVLNNETMGFENARNALLSIIRAGMSHESSAAGYVEELKRIDSLWNGGHLDKLDRSKMSTRYLLKGQNYVTLVAIAATRYSEISLRWIVGGYRYTAEEVANKRLNKANWGSSWSREIGLTVGPLKAALQYAIGNLTKRHGKVIEDIAALWPEGPFASGLNLNAIPVAKADDEADTDTTTNGTAAMNTNTAAAPAINAPVIADAMKPMVNAVLDSAGLKGLTIDALLESMVNAKKAIPMIEAATKSADDYRKKLETAEAKLARAASLPQSMTIPTSQVGGALPSGKTNMVKAETIFPELKGLDFPVPVFTWDSPHPDVPTVNTEYNFRRTMLVKVLRGLTSGANTWLSGHTGTGKTTLIEQIAARLGWPIARIAFDSALDRAEMVGRMQLKGDGKGGTVSEWLPGILERAIANNYILLCDEIDVSRPDALYTLQPLLEGKGLELLEDGGRRVHRAPLSRIVATGNTTGNGDPSGLYQSCRILAAATLDRFNSWVVVPYMTEQEEESLIKKNVAGLPAKTVKALAKFAQEMRTAFVNGNLPISYSPRRSLAFAHAIADFSAMGMPEDKAKSVAFCQSIYDSAPAEFKQRIAELAQLTLGGVNTEIEA